jgi:hypothetical protein
MFLGGIYDRLRICFLGKPNKESTLIIGTLSLDFTVAYLNSKLICLDSIVHVPDCIICTTT